MYCCELPPAGSVGAEVLREPDDCPASVWNVEVLVRRLRKVCDRWE